MLTPKFTIWIMSIFFMVMEDLYNDVIWPVG